MTEPDLTLEQASGRLRQAAGSRLKPGSTEMVSIAAQLTELVAGLRLLGGLLEDAPVAPGSATEPATVFLTADPPDGR